MRGHVLVVDDEASMCEMLAEGLSSAGYEVDTCCDADAAWEALGRRSYDVVVTDVRMRGASGLDLCARVVGGFPGLPVVVVTAFGSLEVAIEAIRAGAFDFVTKPFDLAAIRDVVARSVMHRRVQRQVERLDGDSDRAPLTHEDLVGESSAMRGVRELIERVADAATLVLVTGESGTGKELVARAIHRQSSRRDGPFVAVNCAAVPAQLLESELFGHVRGAFTDARETRPGLFTTAHEGTLFLDEIGELPLEVQPKLLRALQERVVRPVGAEEERPFGARIVVATNIDLEAAVAEGRFREDLFYRVNVIQIHVPPLRDRSSDVLLLAQFFLQRFAESTQRSVIGLMPQAAAALLAYAWPGNVRELQNCIESAVTLARFERITVEDLPARVREGGGAADPVMAAQSLDSFGPMEDVERRYILAVFEAAGRNKSLTARVLGLNRKTLYRKLERFGIDD